MHGLGKVGPEERIRREDGNGSGPEIFFGGFQPFHIQHEHKPAYAKGKAQGEEVCLYKLLIDTVSIANDVTVLGVDMRVRFTGYVK